MLTISSRLESLTADLKQPFHLMDKIKQSRHLSLPIIVEKPKQLVTLKKHEEQQQQDISDNVVVSPKSPKLKAPPKHDAPQKRDARAEIPSMKKPEETMKMVDEDT